MYGEGKKVVIHYDKEQYTWIGVYAPEHPEEPEIVESENGLRDLLKEMADNKFFDKLKE